MVQILNNTHKIMCSSPGPLLIQEGGKPNAGYHKLLITQSGGSINTVHHSTHAHMDMDMD